MKRCSKCGEFKEVGEFWKTGSYCKTCGKASNKERKAKIKAEFDAMPKDAYAGLSKQCTRCGETKPVEDFPRAPGGQYGRRSHCKACNRLGVREAYHRKHPEAPYNYRPRFSEGLGYIVKRCSICGVEKPVTEFHKRPGGYHSPCKACNLALHKSAYDADPEKHRARSREYARTHADAHRQRYQEWHEANRERRILYYHTYQAAHRISRNAYDRARHAKETPEFRRHQYISRLWWFRRYGMLHRDHIRENGQRWRRLNPHKNADRTQRRRARLLGATVEVVDRLAIIVRDNSTCYRCGKICEPHELTLDHVVPLVRGGAHSPDNLRVACRTCNSRKGMRLLEELD